MHLTPETFACPLCRLLWALQGRTVALCAATLQKAQQERCPACGKPWRLHAYLHPHVGIKGAQGCAGFATIITPPQKELS